MADGLHTKDSPNEASRMPGGPGSTSSGGDSPDPSHVCTPGAAGGAHSVQDGWKAGCAGSWGLSIGGIFPSHGERGRFLLLIGPYFLSYGHTKGTV